MFPTEWLVDQISIQQAEAHDDVRRASVDGMPLRRLSGPETEIWIFCSLDGIDRRLQPLERDVGIATETLALLVRFWLGSTQALPDAVQARRAQQSAGLG
jgi:hypothetical protein